jgi:hypothetical protein
MDNIENLDEEYIALLESLPEDERNRFLLGLYSDVNDGAVYHAFDRDKHVESFEINKTPGSIFIGMDFNVDPMTAVLFYEENSIYHVFDEIYLAGSSDTFKMCSELMKRGYSGLTVIPDSTGANRKTSGKSDFKILEDNNFSIARGVRNPFVTDRVNNINRLFMQSKLIIHTRCKKLINDLEKVSWKDNKLDQSSHNKHLTHISDALGYGMWYLSPLLNKKKQRTIHL